ncbi:MAG: YihA family ribosome biogenesis GTP-binding protein [Opitutaceae bacterium]|nr:YihA family ribosome biogenesis GTP-binding protein [Cytophagales bacterium]
MIIRAAAFIQSVTDHEKCPPPLKPEFAFVGRSNVGKSSLINYLTGYDKLAKTSGTPGKTQTINHFIINNEWFLVDLPGYGYAKVSQEQRAKWIAMLHNYLDLRKNLINTFILIDSRLEPQKNDIEFINWMGLHNLPFSVVFTKTDKLSTSKIGQNVELFKKELLKFWDELPPIFLTSAEKRTGKEEILEYIQKNIAQFHPEEAS